jgi:hypothetical protein
MGGGSISVLVGTNNERQSLPLSDYINEELLHQYRRLLKNETSSSITPSTVLLKPYYDVTTDEALVMILDLLSMKKDRIKPHPSVTLTSKTLISPNTRLELVCISSVSNKHQKRRRMIRKRISNIWGIRKKSRASS